MEHVVAKRVILVIAARKVILRKKRHNQDIIRNNLFSSVKVWE